MHLDYHRTLLMDRVRTRALERAVEAAVRPGDVVVDLGAGSGVLSLFACRAGAARVWAIEEHEGMAALLRAIVADNGMAERVRVIEGRSTGVEVPERADLLVAEILGSYALDEGILGYLPDARERFLKPAGRVLPQRVRIVAAPAEAPATYDAHVGFWAGRPWGVDFGAAHRAAANLCYPVEAGEPLTLAAPGATWLDASAAELEPGIEGGPLHFRIERPAVVHGIVVWFESELAPGVPLGTGPSGPGCGTWRPGLFPLGRPLAVHEGDTMEVVLQAIACEGGVLWTWAGEVRTADGSHPFHHTTARHLSAPRTGEPR